MKKQIRILTLLFVGFLAFIGVSTTKAEVTKASSIVNDKFSKEQVVAKLKRVNSIIKRGKANCNQMTLNCFELLGDLIGAAHAATSACGGANGSNYDSWACSVALFYVDLVTAQFTGAGCEYLLSDVTVNPIKPNRKMRFFERQTFATSNVE